MKRGYIILAFLIVQLFFSNGVAQEIASGNQIAIDLTLTEHREYRGYRFQDPIPAGVKVYWDFEVTTSGANVNFFIMDEANWTNFDEDGGIVYPILAMHEVAANSDDIEIPQYGHWYFVFRNPIEQDGSVNVTGEIALDGELNTTIPPPGEIDAILVIALAAIGITIVGSTIIVRNRRGNE